MNNKYRSSYTIPTQRKKIEYYGILGITILFFLFFIVFIRPLDEKFSVILFWLFIGIINFVIEIPNILIFNKIYQNIHNNSYRSQRNFHIITVLIGGVVPLMAIMDFRVPENVPVLLKWSGNIFIFVLALLWFYYVFYYHYKQFNPKKYPLPLDLRYLKETTVISSQIDKITEEKNGYSNRPLSLSIEDIIDNSNDSQAFRKFLLSYAVFLGEKGLIIDWTEREGSLELVLREVIWDPNSFISSFVRKYRYLAKIFQKRDLTTLTIYIKALKLSIFISSDDYKNFSREVTFHLLCFGLLQKFKESLQLFLGNDKERAYQVLIT